MVLGAHAWRYPAFAGFWAGIDQQRYLDSARAWASGDLDPARHHYLPAYALMAAPFVRLTPWQPFMLPDLACLLASLFLFVRIARRLAPRCGDALPALCFLAAFLTAPRVFALWIVPWSTTGSAPFQFASVLLALRLAERPTPARALALGAAIALIAGFRPSDAAILLATSAPFALFALARSRTLWRPCLAIAAAGTAGLLAGLLPILLAHTAIFGPTAGEYIAKSASVGIEWRLLPMRWVTIVIDPHPLLPEGAGMAAKLLWLLPGIAGLILAILPHREGNGAHAASRFVAATVVLHWAFYLAYRDLQPYALWRFNNVHYFKWTFPFLVLWAAQFVTALATRRRWRSTALATAATLALFAWRPILRKPVPAQATLQGSLVTLPHGLPFLGSAQPLPLQGDWTTIFFGKYELHAGSATFLNTGDFKVLPIRHGALLLPLRLLPPGPLTLSLPPGEPIGAPDGAPGGAPGGALNRVLLYRQAIVFGLPCDILPRRAVCLSR